MSAIDIHDEEKIARLLHIQRAHENDFITDLNWNRPIDLQKLLLPLDQNSILFPEANAEEKLVISQLMGLIVASTISELEKVAITLKKSTWEAVLDKYPVNPEIRELGEHFYDDERKHSLAFEKYISLFAQQVNVGPSELQKFLPTSQSVLRMLYHLNSSCGGMAVWWLIAAVEEESILIYNYMKHDRQKIDPLYYDLHRAHYEEEMRHKSYAAIMLQINHEYSRHPAAAFFKKFDFIFAELLNITWTFNQLYKVGKLKSLKHHHPFFKTIDRLGAQLKKQSSLHTLNTIWKRAPYTKDMLNLAGHRRIQVMTEGYGAMKLSSSQQVG